MAYKWVVVKIEVPFRVLDIIRRLILGHPKRAQKFDNYPSILTLLSLLITTLNPKPYNPGDPFKGTLLKRRLLRASRPPAGHSHVLLLRL